MASLRKNLAVLAFSYAAVSTAPFAGLLQTGENLLSENLQGLQSEFHSWSPSTSLCNSGSLNVTNLKTSAHTFAVQPVSTIEALRIEKRRLTRRWGSGIEKGKKTKILSSRSKRSGSFGSFGRNRKKRDRDFWGRKKRDSWWNDRREKRKREEKKRREEEEREENKRREKRQREDEERRQKRRKQQRREEEERAERRRKEENRENATAGSSPDHDDSHTDSNNATFREKQGSLHHRGPKMGGSPKKQTSNIGPESPLSEPESTGSGAESPSKRWYETVLFWGVFAGVVVLVAALLAALYCRKVKKAASKKKSARKARKEKQESEPLHGEESKLLHEESGKARKEKQKATKEKQESEPLMMKKRPEPLRKGSRFSRSHSLSSLLSDASSSFSSWSS